MCVTSTQRRRGERIFNYSKHLYSSFHVAATVPNAFPMSPPLILVDKLKALPLQVSRKLNEI